MVEGRLWRERCVGVVKAAALEAVAQAAALEVAALLVALIVATLEAVAPEADVVSALAGRI